MKPWFVVVVSSLFSEISDFLDMLWSFLRVFSDDIQRHLRGGPLAVRELDSVHSVEQMAYVLFGEYDNPATIVKQKLTKGHKEDFLERS